MNECEYRSTYRRRAYDMVGAQSEREKTRDDVAKQAALLWCMLVCEMRMDQTEMIPPPVRADAIPSPEDTTRGTDASMD